MLIKKLAQSILKLAKWDVVINVNIPLPDKCVISIAPHTSNWDFILFRAMGGIAVPRKKGGRLTNSIIEAAKRSDKFVIAVTPEGTRSYNEHWRKGFLHIAYGANLPSYLAYLDFKNKVVALDKEFAYTGNIDDDLKAVKTYYKDIPAKYPDKFGTGL